MRHMHAATESIAAYVARGRAAFDDDSAVREAMVYQIVVLGEAAKAVVSADPTIATELAAIEWALLAKMRDKITHQYWALDRELVWSTAQRDIPVIATLLADALRRFA